MAENGQWAGLGHYPEDLQWEALVDVLRGRVKVCWVSRSYQEQFANGTNRFIFIVMRQLT